MSPIKEERRSLEYERWEGIPLGSGKAEKATVQEEAQRLLLESPYWELWDVACDFHGGVLTLRGRVPSYFLKQVAQTIVFVMERVEIINNRLEVVASQDGKR